MKPFWQSKKFWTFAGTTTATLLNEFLGVPVPRDMVVTLIMFAGSFIVGQGIADSKR